MRHVDIEAFREQYYAVMSGAMDGANESDLARQIDSALSPQELVGIKMILKGFIERGGKGPFLSVMFMDMALSLVAVATGLMRRNGTQEAIELADSMWEAMRVRVGTFETLSKAERRQQP